jgi:hypothetical protein
MPAEAVRIDELILRAPGLTEEVARRMGEEVARRVAGSLRPYGRVARLGALELRLTIPYGIPHERLAEQVALAILEKLR